MNRLCLLITILLVFPGCAKNTHEIPGSSFVSTDSTDTAPVYAAVNAPANGRFDEMFTLYVETTVRRGSFEPEYGYYTVDSYEMRLGGEFPFDWILSCIAANKTPLLSILPPESNALFDDELLQKTAEAAGTYNIPLFINFYPLTSAWVFNSPAEYRAFFIKAKAEFAESAPNAAFVWSVCSENVYSALNYYPGDAYADWAGLYVLHEVTSDGGYADFTRPLDYFYHTFQRQKPIMINAAVSSYSPESNKYFESEAAERFESFHQTLINEYPRVKLIDSARNPAFSAEITQASGGLMTVPIKSPFPVYKRNGELYLSERSLIRDAGITPGGVLNNTAVTVNGEKCFLLRDIVRFTRFESDVDEENRTVTLK